MSTVTLEGDALRITIDPAVGGSITGICHKATGLSILGTVPWKTVESPLYPPGAADETEWLTRYSGGWPLLFPNGGDACERDGVFHGFHGEASVAPWQAEKVRGKVTLTRKFSSVKATMRRFIAVSGETLVVREELDYEGETPTEVMWGHHPTFGGDLISSEFEVTCGASRAIMEPQYVPPTNPLVPGGEGVWPLLQGGRGIVDLSRPADPWATLVYLSEFKRGWAAIRRLDNAIAAILRWDEGMFPCAWLWYELKGTAEAPWNGCTRLIGIEPNSTPCALGLGEASRRGAPLLRLLPGVSMATAIHLKVFTPSGPILSDP